jgi:hypothetical protein
VKHYHVKGGIVEEGRRTTNHADEMGNALVRAWSHLRSECPACGKIEWSLDADRIWCRACGFGAEIGPEGPRFTPLPPFVAPSPRTRLVYIAGPYRAATRWEEERNVRAAEALGYAVAELGAYPVIPHCCTRPYFADAQPGSFWLAATLELLRRCDAVLLAAGWEQSEGAQAEKAEAHRLGLPVFLGPPHLRAWLEGRTC